MATSYGSLLSDVNKKAASTSLLSSSPASFKPAPAPAPKPITSAAKPAATTLLNSTAFKPAATVPKPSTATLLQRRATTTYPQNTEFQKPQVVNRFATPLKPSTPYNPSMTPFLPQRTPTTAKPPTTGTYKPPSLAPFLPQRTPTTTRPPTSSAPRSPVQQAAPRQPTAAPQQAGQPQQQVPQQPGQMPADMSGLGQMLALMMQPSMQSQNVFVGGGQAAGQPLPGQADRSFTGRDPAMAAARGQRNYLDSIRQGFWG